MKKAKAKKADGYTASTLSKGEKVVFTTRPSKWNWAPIGVFGLLSAMAFFYSFTSASTIFFYVLLVVGVYIGMMFIKGIIDQYTTEYVVTNKKVVAKHGWISRKTDELLLKKVEGLDVDQAFNDRLLGFGTVVFSGTGSQKVTFDAIDDPMNAKKQLENLI